MTQNVRYDKAIDVNELQKLAKTPPELQFLMILCSGFDLHGWSTVKIENLEARLRTINAKLKGTNQPEMRDVLTKLASNTPFSDELLKLIRDRLDFRSKSVLDSSSLPVVPGEAKTLTGKAENAGAHQSNMESYSMTESGGGVIIDPTDKEQLSRAYKVL